jgi:SprT protein
MSRKAPQLEFRWASLAKLLRPAPAVAPRTSALQPDPSLTGWCVDAAKALALNELARKVKVSWNPRMQTTAGRAWWPDRTIELNPKLRSCEPDEIWRTLKHELAHLIAYERCGRRRIEPHGVEWQRACSDLGISGEKPCHDLPFKRRQLKRNHRYVCANCAAAIQRVRPIQRVVACHTCCQKFNGGVYSARFRLVEQKPATH